MTTTESISERIERAQIARSAAHKAYYSHPTNAASIELNRARDEHIALCRLDRAREDSQRAHAELVRAMIDADKTRRYGLNSNAPDYAERAAKLDHEYNEALAGIRALDRDEQF